MGTQINKEEIIEVIKEDIEIEKKEPEEELIFIEDEEITFL